MAEIKTMDIKTLQPAPYNPRKITPEAKAALSKSIERFGIVQPIIWNKQSGYVVGGHQRLDVLIEQGVTKTKVIVVDLSPTEEKALNIALNSSLLAGQYTSELQTILDELAATQSEIYSDLRLNELAIVPPEPPKSFTEYDFDITTNHTCPKCGYKWSGEK